MPDDLHFMQRALELAASTTALASPNPQVGCVLVQNGRIIGEGVHLYEAHDHAEIAALKNAAALGHAVKGATAYVILEPCSHTGRTGPCADALIAAGIGRCVVATGDPNPFVHGSGLQRLRDAGVEVTLGVLEQPARELNDAFAHFIQTRTPFVTLKAAISVDGKLAPPPTDRAPGKPHWITGPEARAEVQRLRHASDAVLTGINTVLADDPAYTDRTGLPRRRPLLRVILDTHLRIPLDSQLVRSASTGGTPNEDLLIFCGISASASKIAALEDAGAEVEPIVSHNGRLSLPAVLTDLHDRAIVSLLLECGSHLNGSFLAQRLVDKVVLFCSETELGEAALPFASGFPSPFLLEQSLRRTTHTLFGPPDRPDSCLTGYLTDPWPPSVL
ncbi:bifunctional diaminohydroxyphosphoribosylaminopyrimidine deaminase/5-amino-6-(5-phosphoribosylamino)uracil reductase RibD [Granulicella aggregans]|jgi:diaminohydroxyphosphoribosylaminopyrimidine deaminase/5-amino-6-(5-phosphoribosylamino)uracil reductase|uniref:bifunctional diaminohydroxyphosphoribosylaminopyrimidine deaminase/5-amino-6-(5-phosphoribosylamino)uracil reductase RibD n=1 Tax=Granulicella aggregans TaxID=474949 RepID=UPI0021E0D4E5|nr:bifunctional diaminohydroxyphosphoribosylaminopyrimidine deaminase/5-amino-6-(5-phosphoribosylamino)uracil reductase RibD [Granulicella aggregans]